jgi:SulP family sulfate permease
VLRRYGWSQLLGDACGGLIAALIALPYGLAMAAAMGLPPVLGIFTSIFTAPVTALLGRNPVLIGGTGSATIPFIAGAVHAQGVGGAAKVCLAAAVIMMAFCVMRLGRHIMKVPQAVVTGFSCGIGGMMVVSQLATILGIQKPQLGGSTLDQLAAVLQHINEFRLAPFFVGALVVLIATVAMRFSPRSPAPLISVAVAVAVVQLFGLHVAQVGVLPQGLPAFAGFNWSASDVWTVLPAALGLAFVTSVNILITSRVVEHFRGRHRPMRLTDADAELGAYGIANLCGGVFGAPLSVGIPARSLAVVRCGGTTRLANLLHAAFLIVMLRYGSSFIAQVPITALAGVTAWMGFCLLDWSAWRRLPKMSRVDAAAFLATAASVLLFNAVLAVGIGCSLYALPRLLRLLRSERSPVPEAVQ